ncbi:uncharacterized protein KY384_001380 [Bacidia gigantensis]|uniref:uncharacterized protein n=1 Tax=Bacidia gigantensis TaxID=2732470 RepID=UPI001D037763|nr:uncharacterized protein KY384_001380 [Bacidia gigantensis]KAG8533639.1 hypothetical protein KY384_001380 [Bacidia gigantensis]
MIFPDLNSHLAWQATGVLVACATIAYVWLIFRDDLAMKKPGKQQHNNCIERKSKHATSTHNFDPDGSDPGLLKKHSTFQSYTTSYATYASVRTFYRRHPQEDKFPSKPAPLPLLVFVHGLGGSLAQFKAVLTGLGDVAPCLGIDFPGCGRSEFSPTTWSAYTPDALTELLRAAIERHIKPNQGYVLVAHSLGCSVSALIASSASVGGESNSSEILGLIGICPPAEAPRGRQATILQALLCIPTPIFNLWRAWDRRGGPYSASVARFVGLEADIEVKKLQERFNAQSQTPVYRRMAWGLFPHGSKSTGMAGLATWAKLRIPILLVAGEGDAVTKISNIQNITRALRKSQLSPLKNGSGQPNAEINLAPDHQSVNFTGTQFPDSHQTHPILKTTILPAPASHALLYDPATSRTLCGLIHTFLSTHISPRLSLGWQLQHLSADGKWDVKNLAKWQSIAPISAPIAGIFRAMKTLREVDDEHNPSRFAREYAGTVKTIIDISHDSPVYDPKGLEDKGVRYHKFPTVSKMPPTRDEVREFIGMVDRIEREGGDGKETNDNVETGEKKMTAVHCHYGFNRTGFFICAYLIEKMGYTVRAAVDEFAERRPPGIRHEHFLDELWVRYCVGLKRSGTL